MGDAGARQLRRCLAAGHRRMRGEKQRDAANAVVKIGAEADELEHFGIAEPVEPDPGRARTAANGVTRQLRGDPVGFGDEIRWPLRRHDRYRQNIRRRVATPRAAARLGKIELVFSRMTSICQAMSCSSRLRQRARARSRPGVASVRTETPSASPISSPSLGDTKCGTFNGKSAARSARCSGHSGSDSLVPFRQPRDEVGLRRPDRAVVHAAMVFQALQQHVVEAGRADDLADRQDRQSRRTAAGPFASRPDAAETWHSRQSPQTKSSIWSPNLA